MNKRAFSLDAFRGYAILTMVLSATVASGVLPAWMYHAQVGPRSDYAFDPSIYGITWVDLVFPFFLFAMGASFPFSIGNKLEKGEPKLNIIWDCLLRGIRLTFFAIFIQHMNPWAISSQPNLYTWFTSLFAFALMFPMFMRIPVQMPKWANSGIKLLSYAIAIYMLLSIHYANGKHFSLYDSDIIIMILANMSIFGSLAYLFTVNSRISRIAILPFIMAILLGGKTDNSWAKEVLNYSPIQWMYNFQYLKYLFIVIPGSIAGEYLREWVQNNNDTSPSLKEKRCTPYILLLTIGIIIFNLYGLYTRQLILNLAGTIVLLSITYWLLQTKSNNMIYWKKMFVAGSYLILLGLFFEAFEGGIRKDDSTYSYYFVTAGLAFMAMISFSILCDVYKCRAVTQPLKMAGQNPMIAYVATNLVIMPLLSITGLAALLSLLEQNAWLGFLRGVILTSLATLVAISFTKLKWFWKT